MKTPEPGELLATMESLLAQLDALDLMVPALHLNSAVEAMRQHITEEATSAHLHSYAAPGLSRSYRQMAG